MNLLNDVNPISPNGEYVRVLIEIPKGSIHKYEYDPRGVLTVVRDLDKKYKYPYNYGCVPGTLAGDNDPLDAIVISDEAFKPCTIVNCKVVGLIKMEDNGEEDHKLLCVPSFSSLKKIKLTKILKYLDNYKYPYQEGTKILGVYNSTEAWKEVHKAMLTDNKLEDRQDG